MEETKHSLVWTNILNISNSLDGNKLYIYERIFHAQNHLLYIFISKVEFEYQWTVIKYINIVLSHCVNNLSLCVLSFIKKERMVIDIYCWIFKLFLQKVMVVSSIFLFILLNLYVVQGDNCQYSTKDGTLDLRLFGYKDRPRYTDIHDTTPRTFLTYSFNGCFPYSTKDACQHAAACVSKVFPFFACWSESSRLFSFSWWHIKNN